MKANEIKHTDAICLNSDQHSAEPVAIRSCQMQLGESDRDRSRLPLCDINSSNYNFSFPPSESSWK